MNVAIDTILTDLPTGQVFVPKQTNRQLLTAVMRQSAVTVEFPCDTHTAEILLRAMGYRHDRKVLNNILSAGKLKRPKRDARGFFRWTKEAIIDYADQLESRRRWIGLHPSHVHKMNSRELVKARDEAAKKHAIMTGFASMPLNDVLNLLADCDERETRMMLAYIAKVKCGIIDPDARGNNPPTDPDPASVN